MSKVRLSIIIPVFNVEAYVSKTLESVFDTSAPLEAFEVIVVNDGTKDRSMDVVRRFSDRQNLIIYEQKNQGLSAARMNGLSLASGEYVWFIDSDDWVVDDAVGKVLAMLDQNVGTDVLMFPLLRVYDDVSLNHLDYQFNGRVLVEGKAVIRDLSLYVWCAPRYVFRRSLMENRYLFFPLGLLHEDEYFGPVLMYLAKRVCVYDQHIYCRLIRPGSIMTTLSVRSSFDTVSIHRLLMEFMKAVVDVSDREWFRSHCFNQLMTSYSFNEKYFGVSEFNRFVRKNGFYVWKEWLAVNREKSLGKKIKRAVFFLFPGMRKSCLRLFQK